MFNAALQVIWFKFRGEYHLNGEYHLKGENHFVLSVPY